MHLDRGEKLRKQTFLMIVVLAYIFSIIGAAAADESVSNDSDSSDITDNFTAVDPDNTTDESTTSDNETAYETDPTTGALIDPTTGELIDPETGDIIDSTSADNETAYETDPTTGDLIDPTTGDLIDPETGYLIDPTTGDLIDPESGYYLIDPITGELIDPETRDVINSTDDSDNTTYPISAYPILGDGDNSDIEPVYLLAKETSTAKDISFSQSDVSGADNKTNITAGEKSTVLAQINGNGSLITNNKTINPTANNNEHFIISKKNSTNNNSSTVPPKSTGNPFLPFLMIFGGAMTVKMRK